MALGGRFIWNDQGETPNTMFGIAEYPNGQYVFFNVRNVNYNGYQRQVKNEYYFEDGGKIDTTAQYYPKGSDQGREGRVPRRARSPRAAASAASSPPAAPASPKCPTATCTWPTTPASSAT